MTRAEGELSSRQAAGFTVLELLVVLAILSLAAAVTIPAVRPSRQAMSLKVNVTVLTAQMRALRSAALSGNIEHALLIDLRRNLFWIDGSDRVRRLSPQLALSARMRSNEVIGPATVRFRFHPDGTASGGAVVLSDGSRSARVAVDWRSSAPRIEWSN